MQRLILIIVMTWSVSGAVSAEMIEVEKGDTLWKLSQKHLGNPWLWPCFKDSNPLLVDEKKLEVGEFLEVPEPSQCQKYAELDPGYSKYPSPKKKQKAETKAALSTPPVRKPKYSPYYISAETDEVYVYSNGEIKIVSKELLHSLMKNGKRETKAKALINGTVFDRALMEKLTPQDPRQKELL